MSEGYHAMIARIWFAWALADETGKPMSVILDELHERFPGGADYLPAPPVAGKD